MKNNLPIRKLLTLIIYIIVIILFGKILALYFGSLIKYFL